MKRETIVWFVCLLPVIISRVSHTKGRRLEGDGEHHKVGKSGHNLFKAMDHIKEVTNLIYQRFEFHNKDWFQFFIESSNMPDYGWDLQKYKIAKKIIDGNSHFLMIFGGSSVTAGHDNYYKQSYPAVFERRMAPIFNALGVKLLVRNIAQGANNCKPSIYCYEAMGGENPDWIGWEQSFNCGRSRDIFEYFARLAYWYGAVAYYSASGAFLPNGCAESSDPIPWTYEEWTPESSNITDKYVITPELVTSYRKMQMDWFCDGNSVSRFTSVFGPLYNGVGPHGFSVWGHSSKLCNNGKGCTAIDVKGECHDKGGPHWMVQQTAWYANQKGKHGKEWHPSAGMHLMRGEIIAYNLAHIIADAIYMIENDFKNGTVTNHEELSKRYQQKINELRVPIPEKALYLSAEDGAYKPNCYTNYEPHYNIKQLLGSVIVGNHSGWNIALTNPQREREDKIYGYLDRRPYYEAREGGLELYVQIIDVKSHVIRVCGYEVKDSMKHALFYLDPNILIVDPRNMTQPHTTSHHHHSDSVSSSGNENNNNNGNNDNANAATTDTTTTTAQNNKRYSSDEYIPTSNRYQLTKRKYVQDECTMLTEIPLGNHILTIKTDPQHGGHPTAFSHVIVF